MCSHNPETTVLAHLNGGGMGMKHSDFFGAFSCGSCHSWLDGGYAKHHDREYRDLMHLQAMQRTQQWWIDNVMVVIK